MFKPHALGVAFFVGLVLATTVRTLALTEYCPALIWRTHAVNPAADGSTQLWAYTLGGLGSRSVSGLVLAQTDSGWFGVPFPKTELVRSIVRYASPSISYSQSEFESPPLYVQFPRSVRIRRWWVDSATAYDDNVFGWDQKGLVTCDPPAGLTDRLAPREPQPSPSGDSDGPQIPVAITPDIPIGPPSPGTHIAQALVTGAPSGMSACDQPFTSARVVTSPDFEYPAGSTELGNALAGVELAISSTGTLDDSWILYSSGDTNLDKNALSVADSSTFSAGTALCKPVPGVYLFLFSYDGFQ